MKPHLMGKGSVAGSQESINEQRSLRGEWSPEAGGEDGSDADNLGVLQAGAVPVHEGVACPQLTGEGGGGVGEGKVRSGQGDLRTGQGLDLEHGHGCLGVTVQPAKELK